MKPGWWIAGALLIAGAALVVLGLDPIANVRGPSAASPAVTIPSPALPRAPPTPPGQAPADDDPERALLQQAEQALTSEPSRALELLREGDARFPSGALADERQFLKLRARVNLDQIAEARVDAIRYLELNPRSPIAPRIHQLLGIRPPPDLRPAP